MPPKAPADPAGEAVFHPAIHRDIIGISADRSELVVSLQAPVRWGVGVRFEVYTNIYAGVYSTGCLYVAYLPRKIQAGGAGSHGRLGGIISIAFAVGRYSPAYLDISLLGKQPNFDYLSVWNTQDVQSLLSMHCKPQIRSRLAILDGQKHSVW